MSNKLVVVSFALVVSALSASAGATTLLQNKGSDTLVNVAQAWAEAYQKVNPNVAIAVSGGGSGTGIAALINGTVDIANASRKMKDQEIQLAEKHGQEPVQHVVGYDALAVFIHKDNPAKTLTEQQLAEIFGRDGKARNWSDLGITVPGCSDGEIVVVGRQNNSGTYAYFKHEILGKKGKYRQGTLDMNGSKDVVDLVGKTPCAIGYSGLAYATDEVTKVCVSKDGKPCIMPSVASASDGSYPIARPLFMYTNGKPTGDIAAYLNWVLSDEGQCIILNKGYAPVRAVQCK
jgi:phosphate transport system substrate-binding protein